MDDRPCALNSSSSRKGRFIASTKLFFAHFLDDEPLTEVAERFGYKASTPKSMQSRDFPPSLPAVSRPPFLADRPRTATRAGAVVTIKVAPKQRKSPTSVS